MVGLPEKNRPCTGTPPNVAVVPRFAPAIFTSVAPPVDPTFGDIDVTDGNATTVGASVDAGIEGELQPAVAWAISRGTIPNHIRDGQTSFRDMGSHSPQESLALESLQKPEISATQRRAGSGKQEGRWGTLAHSFAHHARARHDGPEKRNRARPRKIEGQTARPEVAPRLVRFANS